MQTVNFKDFPPDRLLQEHLKTCETLQHWLFLLCELNQVVLPQPSDRAALFPQPTVKRNFALAVWQYATILLPSC